MDSSRWGEGREEKRRAENETSAIELRAQQPREWTAAYGRAIEWWRGDSQIKYMMERCEGMQCVESEKPSRMM